MKMGVMCVWAYMNQDINFKQVDILIPYSGNFSRTINFAVFVDFTSTSKINPRKSYYSIQMQ